MKKKLILFMSALLAIVSARADDLSVTWPMGASTTGTAFPAAAASNISYSVGSGLTENGTSSWNGITFSKFEPSSGTTYNNNYDDAISSKKYVDFSFIPVNGFFTPKSVSFDIVKIGTNGPTVYVDFIDGEEDTITVATNETIIRNNDTSSTAHSYTVSGAATSENAVTLRIIVGQLPESKSVGIANVVINGTYRTKQTLNLSSIPTITYGSTYSLPTTTNEGLPLTWNVDDNTVSSASDGILTAMKVGTATVTATQAGNNSYMPFSKEYALTVSKAMLTVTANDASKVYGAANPVLSMSYTGFVNGDDATTLTTQPTVTTTATLSSAAGTYPLTVAGGASDNYEFNYVAGTLTVSKAALTITANDATKTYGAANPTLSVSYSGFVNGDDATKLTTQPTVTTTATQSSAAGTYPITASGAAADNYDMTYVAGTLTVTKASQNMALTAIPAQTYGATAYTLPTTTAQGQTLTWTVTNTDIATVSNGSLTIKKAGTTKVTATQAGTVNYDAFSKEFTLTVNKAALTITANDATKVYGAANPTLSVIYSGFVNGDDATKLTTQPTVTTTATQSSAVGTYPITASGAASDNYTFTYKAGTLNVTKAALTITANDATKTYGTDNPTLSVSYSGFVNGDDATKLTTQPTVTTTATAGSAVGTYPITASGATSDNYTFTYKAGTLTVTKAALTITADDKTKDVGDENPELTVTYSGFVNGDDASSLTIQPTVTTTATASSPAGTYPITASGAASGNYDITYVDGTLTVADAYSQGNTLSGLDAKGLAGNQATLEIALTNADVVSLCQFDLRLPAGVTVALNSKNKLDATLSDRASTHSISSSQLANGDYRFVVSSLDGDAFTGNEGTLMNIVLDIANDVVPGEYEVKLTGIELSLPVGSDLRIVHPADAESLLTISDYTPGDVNNDGKVSVTDVGYAINYILEQVPSVFIFDAADMNQDGKITVTDVGYIINLILNDTAGSRPTKSRYNGHEPQ